MFIKSSINTVSNIRVLFFSLIIDGSTKDLFSLVKRAHMSINTEDR